MYGIVSCVTFAFGLTVSFCFGYYLGKGDL
jgi:hypothetical protein